ncbi:hypothetical protein DYB26_003642 [Aphanomyces astaci]|uniref:PPM-type phosphatase domain-containing protein n=1 Tax=Aphanomyces astaci TaxID=112090 RepID=A0A397EYQ3_APHAT|nr:hypothetical protein DYB36_001883 [Aphanomyces astaci]RHY71695.1 hypothetical protein DYB34_004309 [Aphanomyces astaci]RHZ05367.1 hypothetical protein DYB31_005985 [Aphanomyces astaci]RHZ08007.1 hypothetical protein DYB26_003642 [Aphanomyces astaci]
MEMEYLRSNVQLPTLTMTTTTPIKSDPLKTKVADDVGTLPVDLEGEADALADEDDEEDNQAIHIEGNLVPLHSAFVSWKSPTHANEDRAVIYRGSRFSVFAVIDGHGGDLASEYVKTHLVDILDEEPDLTTASLRHATATLERRFGELATAANDFSGACFVALVVVEDGSRTRFVINCGDCRISALERQKKHRREYKALSTDHKASCPLEKQRIARAGGYVIMDRVAGVLAPSRSIGDLDMKVPGMEGWVVADPEINEDVLCRDSLYVLATDGVWDVMSDRDVLCLAETSWLDNQVAHDGTVGCASSCEAIAQDSVARGSRDDITCIVIRTGDW